MGWYGGVDHLACARHCGRVVFAMVRATLFVSFDLSKYVILHRCLQSCCCCGKGKGRLHVVDFSSLPYSNLGAMREDNLLYL